MFSNVIHSACRCSRVLHVQYLKIPSTPSCTAHMHTQMLFVKNAGAQHTETDKSMKIVVYQVNMPLEIVFIRL